LILLSDANVLIDLGYVDGLYLLTHLAPTEVLDVVLLKCEHEQQPDLVAAIQDSGVSVIVTEASWVRAARAYKAAELSVQDRLNLYYAKTYGRILLAGDKPLRNRCAVEGVEVHSSLWLVEQAFAGSLVAPQELCRWLKLWPTLGRRLPEAELCELAQRLGCEPT
jgi:hypothetical protein